MVQRWTRTNESLLPLQTFCQYASVRPPPLPRPWKHPHPPVMSGVGWGVPDSPQVGGPRGGGHSPAACLAFPRPPPAVFQTPLLNFLEF